MAFLQERFCSSKFYVFETLQIVDCRITATPKESGRPPRSLIDASYSTKVKKGPAKPIPNRSIRTDGYKHWPEFCEKKVVVEILDVKESQKWSAQNMMEDCVLQQIPIVSKSFMSKLSDQIFNQG